MEFAVDFFHVIVVEVVDVGTLLQRPNVGFGHSVRLNFREVGKRKIRRFSVVRKG